MTQHSISAPASPMDYVSHAQPIVVLRHWSLRFFAQGLVARLRSAYIVVTDYRYSVYRPVLLAYYYVLFDLLTDSVTDSVNYPLFLIPFHVFIPPHFHRFRIKSLMQFYRTAKLTLFFIEDQTSHRPAWLTLPSIQRWRTIVRARRSYELGDLAS